MKLYLAGPMSGLPNFNYDLFGLATLMLRERGHEVHSPHEGHDKDPGEEDYSYYLISGIEKLLRCDAIVLLPGYEASKGAILELHIAIKCKMAVYNFDPKVGVLIEE